MGKYVPGEWFDYSGQTTEELLALASDYRIDSLVCAFEDALINKADADLSREERYVLAIEALEREVNNGGYAQFFQNSSNEFVDVIEVALRAIGCPVNADIARDALGALRVPVSPTAAAAQRAIAANDAEMRAALRSCDARYFARPESIEDRLFAWIGTNREAIRIGAREDVR